MLVNAAVQYVLTATGIALSPRPASSAMAVVLGSAGAGIVSAGMALSMLVAMNGTVMSGARVPYRCRPRPIFFLRAGDSASPISYPLGCHRRAGVLAVILLLFGGNFRQFFLSGDFRRMALLYDRGYYCVCVSLARSRRRRGLIESGDIRWFPRCLSWRQRCCCTTRLWEIFLYRHLGAWPFWPAFQFSTFFPRDAESNS